MKKKKNSVKANAFFNTFKETLDIAAPMITFPYVTRMLLPENLGKVQFSLSVIAVFTYFATLGLPLYGTRKIAAMRDDIKARSRIFMNLITIELVTTSLVYIAFLISIFYVEKFRQELVLYLILGIRIGFKTFGFEWFFKGMEEYKFMAYRKTFAKVLGIILTFTLINGPEDYVLYGTISVITMFFSRVFNYWNLRKMIVKVPIKELNPKEHIMGSIYFFMIFFSGKLYHNIDKIMLGFISGNASVSFYVTANKLIRIIKTLFTAATAVLIPRIANLIARNKMDKVKRLAQKAFSVVFFLPLPAMVGLYILSYEVVMIFGGEKYLPSVLTMRILLPLLVMIPYKSLIGKKILLTHGKQSLVLTAILIATCINIGLNILLIPRFSHYGAAAATIVAEIVIISIEMTFGWAYISQLELSIRKNLVYVWASLIMAAAVYGFKHYVLSESLSYMHVALICSAVGGVVYGLVLVIMRESLFLPMISKAFHKRIKRKKSS